jgi:hypothetical protein
MQELSLRALRLCAGAGAPAVALLRPLAGHASLSFLDIACNFQQGDAAVPWQPAALGAALAALVAADAPALRDLDVSDCALGDAGLGPLVDALRHNTHLRALDCGGNANSDAFARSALLPALRANRSLRQLRAALSTREAREVSALLSRSHDGA